MNFTAVSPRQIRAARMLLGWSQSDLAKHAKVSITVIARIETEAVDARISTLMAILKAFDEQGVEFVSDADGSVGLLHHPPTAGAASVRDGAGRSDDRPPADKARERP